MQARKRFGQNFLTESSVTERIHQVLDLKASERVLEVGPGQGQLTEGLLDSGADVLAVEIDQDLVTLLQSKFSNLTVLEGSILDVDSSIFKGRRVIGNLPYNIATPLLLRLIDLREEFVDLHCMIQKEVADRLVAVAGTKSWSRLSVRMQQVFDITHLFDVFPPSFTPQPKVISSFVRVNAKRQPLLPDNQDTFDQVLKSAFGQRRKMLVNSLGHLSVYWQETNVDSSLRAEQVTIEQYLAISNTLA